MFNEESNCVKFNVKFKGICREDYREDTREEVICGENCREGILQCGKDQIERRIIIYLSENSIFSKQRLIIPTNLGFVIVNVSLLDDKRKWRFARLNKEGYPVYGACTCPLRTVFIKLFQSNECFLFYTQ